MSPTDTRPYEVTFCSRVAGWANEIFAQHPDWPFRRTEIEQSKAIHRMMWPVKLTADYLITKSNQDRNFDYRLQEWIGQEQGWLFARNDPKEWRAILDRSARTLCYVFANRLIFYESCRAKFGELLDPLDIPGRLKPDDLIEHWMIHGR